MDRDQLRAWLRQGMSLQQIGREVNRHPETVSYWVRKHGLTPNGQAKHAALGSIPRGELERAVAEGLSIADLAALFGRSKGTVRYWLRRYGLRTVNEAQGGRR